MKNILVTGGAGFIGSNYIKYMLNKYDRYKIINLDLLTYAGNLENLREIKNNQNHLFIKGDIGDRELVNQLFDQYAFQYVINLAAESHVDRSIQDPGIFVRTNIMGTQVLLDTAMNRWRTGTDEQGYPLYREDIKYLQISTDEVYGSLGSAESFSEKTPLAPTNPYAASKASADLLVKSYHKTYKLPINITRCSNNYGPYQFTEKLIPLMITNAIEDKKLPIYGDGLQIRDWLHVKDHCNAIDMVLHHGKIGEIYNIGGNSQKTNIEIVKMVIDYLGKTEGLIQYVKDRLGHDQRYAMDYTKLSTELGWEPYYTFPQGIKETIQWYLDNHLWWEKVRKKG